MPIPDFGPYEVLKLIGAGAYSHVYKVCRRDTRKRFAIKHVVADKPGALRFVRQLENEYRFTRSLAHPNIVQVYDLVERKRLRRVREAYLVMELVRGSPLDRREKDYTFEQIVFYFRQAADALAYLHDQGIIHTDVKPKNLIVTSNDLLKIVDFGHATTPGHSKGRVQGTFEFMAPEQVRAGILDVRTDVFNLAASLYHMLSGWHVPPIVEATLGDVDYLPGRSRRPRSIQEVNPRVPAALDDLLRRSCSRVREERPATMTDFIEQFEEALGPS